MREWGVRIDGPEKIWGDDRCGEELKEEAGWLAGEVRVREKGERIYGRVEIWEERTWKGIGEWERQGNGDRKTGEEMGKRRRRARRKGKKRRRSWNMKIELWNGTERKGRGSGYKNVKKLVQGEGRGGARKGVYMKLYIRFKAGGEREGEETA